MSQFLFCCCNKISKGEFFYKDKRVIHFGLEADQQMLGLSGSSWGMEACVEDHVERKEAR